MVNCAFPLLLNIESKITAAHPTNPSPYTISLTLQLSHHSMSPSSQRSATKPNRAATNHLTMSARSSEHSMQPMQPDQAPASRTHADQGPAKRKAMEQPQDDRRPARPGTLPFMWNLPTIPSLPIFNADSTPVMSDDEYEHELELENDEIIDELQEAQEQLHEAKKKIAALEKRLRTYQVIVLPMDYKTTETAEESGNEKSTPEREAEALKAMYEKKEEDNHKDDDEDKIETFRAVLKDIEWAVEEHHRLVDQALKEIESGRTGPAGRCDGYKPGQLPLYILDKSQCTLGVDVYVLKDLFEEIAEEVGLGE